MSKAADAYTSVINQGGTQAEAFAAAEAVFDAPWTGDTATRTSTATAKPHPAPVTAPPVQITETELTFAAMRRDGATDEQIAGALAYGGGLTRGALDTERARMQQEADARAQAEHDASPEGRRQAARAELDTQAERQRDAAGARALLERLSAEAGVTFDASALTDDEALREAGIEPAPLDRQARRVAEADARYEADPIGEIHRKNVEQFRSEYGRLDAFQRREYADAYGLDLASFDAEMQAARSDAA